MGKTKTLLLLAMVSAAIIMTACRKNDWQTPSQKSDKERFFRLPHNSSATIRRAVVVLQEAETRRSFAVQLVQKNGFPLWDKAMTYYDAAARGGDTMLLVPLVPDGSRRVHAIIELRMSDQVVMRVLGAEDYKLYPHGRLAGSSATAERFAVEFMKIEHLVFGYRQFVLRDDSLLKPFVPAAQQANRFLKLNIVPLSASNAMLTTTTTGGDCYEVPVFEYDANGQEWFTGETQWEGNCENNGAGGYPGGFGIFNGGNPVVVSGWTTNAPPTGSGSGWTNWPVYHPPQGWTPSYVDDGQWPKNPCKLADSLMRMARYRALLNQLKLKLTDSFETGYWTQNLHNNNFSYVEAKGPAGTLSIPYAIPAGSIIDAFLHNHYLDSNALSIFSIDDIISMWKLFTDNHMPANPKEFSMTLVTFRGAYMVTIKDVNKFKAFGDLMIKKDPDGLFLNMWFYSRYSILHTNSATVNELNFAQALKEMDTGLALFKSDETMSSYIPITVNNAGNAVITGPCN
jgi:hypothetical protein